VLRHLEQREGHVRHVQIAGFHRLQLGILALHEFHDEARKMHLWAFIRRVRHEFGVQADGEAFYHQRTIDHLEKRWGTLVLPDLVLRVAAPDMGRHRNQGLQPVQNEPFGVYAPFQNDREMRGIIHRQAGDDIRHPAGAVAGPCAAELLYHFEGIRDIRRGDRHTVRPVPGAERNFVGFAVIRRGDGGGEAAGIIDGMKTVDPDELHKHQIRRFLVVQGLHKLRVERSNIRPRPGANAGRNDDGPAVFCSSGRRVGEEEQGEDEGTGAAKHQSERAEIGVASKGSWDSGGEIATWHNF
jgi:hypothetical protein